jgi:hypothetical protein
VNYVAGMKRVVLALLATGTLANADEAAQLGLLDAQAHALHKGAVRVGEPVHGFAPQMDWAASFEPGACYVVAGRVAAGARTVALTLFSPDGKRVASAKPAAATSLRYCATWLGSYHVQARTDAAGTYLVGTYMVSSKSGLPAVVESTPPPLIAGPAPVAPPPSPTVVYQPVYQPVYVPVPVAQPQPTVVYASPQYGGYSQPAPVYTGSSQSSGAQHHGGLIVTPVVGTKGGDCKSSLDCGPGEFCKEDSYGYKACMGASHKGMPCSSSIDCGSGMFCHELDNDSSYKVCE